MSFEEGVDLGDPLDNKKFSEVIPSLKNALYQDANGHLVVFAIDVMRMCLDKERVKKAIEKHDDCAFGDCCFECQSNNNPEKLDCFKYILKELGL